MLVSSLKERKRLQQTSEIDWTAEAKLFVKWLLWKVSLLSGSALSELQLQIDQEQPEIIRLPNWQQLQEAVAKTDIDGRITAK